MVDNLCPGISPGPELQPLPLDPLPPTIRLGKRKVPTVEEGDSGLPFSSGGSYRYGITLEDDAAHAPACPLRDFGPWPVESLT